MKQVILIENRTDRQKHYLPNQEADVDTLNALSFLKNSIGDDCKKNLKQIDENDLTFLSPYDLIIIHRSALAELPSGNATVRISNYASKSNKDLILYSGAITNFYYSETNGKYLLISSKDFYSNNLIPFLYSYANGNSKALVEMVFGHNWKLNYYLKFRELLLNISTEENGTWSNQKDEIEDILPELKKINLETLNQLIFSSIQSI